MKKTFQDILNRYHNQGVLETLEGLYQETLYGTIGGFQICDGTSPCARLSVIPTLGGLAMRFCQCDAIGREGSGWYRQFDSDSTAFPTHDDLKMQLLATALTCNNLRFMELPSNGTI